MNRTDTIFALSSGAGKAGVAVIRISGGTLESEFSRIVNLKDFIQPRHAYFTNLTDDAGALIDQCVAIYFAAPNSFTGEDVIEIHCHGAPAVITKIFDTLRRRGYRMATPGEFSRRAFYNNKMDLADIDGLVALLDARTDKQRINALKSLTGNDSKTYESWRSQMIEISAYAAAILDYASDDLPANIGSKLITTTQKLYDEINLAISGYAKSHAIAHGFNIVLTGDTNVGKSSLFNRLVGSSRAIVSDIPGTTRDVVSAELDIDGYLVNLSDTAGLRDATDTIEKIGIERTHATVANADLILRIISAESEDNENKWQLNGIHSNSTANAVPRSFQQDEVAAEILVLNKCDTIKSEILNLKSEIYVSALTGFGIDKLLDLIKQKMHERLDGAESDIVINERTRGLLTDAAHELKYAIENSNGNYDIFAEHVHSAADSIGKILGVISVTDVMDATFGGLCLGK